MARSLTQYRIDDGLQAQRAESARRVDRSAAMAFGAAIASLLVAALVVNSSAEALEPEGTLAGNSLEVGTITLVDDDQGRSLVDLANMVPDRPVEECIEVTYEGTLLPVEVSLVALVNGPLARFVTVEVDAATSGGYGRCEDLGQTRPLFRGSLAELAAGDPLIVDTYRNTGDGTSFRFHFELQDEAGAIGQAVSVDFRWEAVPV
jgi:hypothetical protein